MEKIVDIINEMASEKCKLVMKGEFLHPGQNGPYHDPESQVRVSAHWIIIFSYVLENTGNNLYREAIYRLAEYICGAQLPNGTFLCRNKAGKDKVNGTIGSAWAIEGLIEAAKVLNEDKYYNVALAAFKAHPFDENLGLWNRRDVTGEIIGYDATYNHQLWLASAGAQLCNYIEDNYVDMCVQRFLECSKDTFRVFDNGLVYHFVYFKTPMLRRLKSFKNYYKQCMLRWLDRPSYKYKEEGYHNFSIYAFAVLHQRYPKHNFFKNNNFKRAVSYSLDLDNSYILSANDSKKDGTGLAQKIDSKCNIYGFSYNSPAFEMPLIVREFSDQDDNVGLNKLLEMQISLTYDEEKKSFCRNTEDAITLDARIYELVRAF